MQCRHGEKLWLWTRMILAPTTTSGWRWAGTGNLDEAIAEYRKNLWN